MGLCLHKQVVYSFWDLWKEKNAHEQSCSCWKLLSIYRSTGEVQVVYGTFWIELFLACHRTFGTFLIRARI